MWEAVTSSPGRNTSGAQDWSEVFEAVRWIQLVMALLSVVGSGSIIVCVTSQRLGRTPELQPLLLLTVSDLLLALCWLTGAALFSHHCSSLNTHCYHLHTAEQVFYMASFFYTLNYMWNLHAALRRRLFSCWGRSPPQVLTFARRHSSRCSGRTDWSTSAGRITAPLSGFLFPVLLMTPVLIQGNISQCEANFSEPYRCLLMHTGALYLTSGQRQPIGACRLLRFYGLAVFLAAFLLTLFSISVLVVKARRTYRRVVTSGGYLGNQQRASFRAMDRRMFLYPLVFVLCWGPAAGLAVLQVAKPSAGQGEAAATLYISQAFTSASQGFLNCVVYGWTRLQRAGIQSQDADTQTPLLSSQKRGRSYQTHTAG